MPQFRTMTRHQTFDFTEFAHSVEITEILVDSVRPKPNIRPKISARSAEYSAPKVSASLPNIRLTKIPEKWGQKPCF